MKPSLLPVLYTAVIQIYWRLPVLTCVNKCEDLSAVLSVMMIITIKRLICCLVFHSKKDQASVADCKI